MIAFDAATLGNPHLQPTTPPPGRPGQPSRPHLRVLDGGRAPARLAAQARFRRRRLVAALAVLGVVAVLSILANAAVASLAGGGSPAAGDPPPGSVVAPGTADPAAVHVVQPGDTLWSIAAEIAPGRDVRATVDELRAANGGARLTVGQRLVLPGPD